MFWQTMKAFLRGKESLPKSDLGIAERTILHIKIYKLANTFFDNAVA